MVMACRGNILKRVLCLLLCFVLLFCFFASPRAHAVALEAATVAYAASLVGVILVGAGVIFKSHGDMQQVGAAMYKSFQKANTAIATKIGALASWAVEHGEAVAKGALRVGKDLWQGIVDAFNASYSNGYFSSDHTYFDFSGDISAVNDELRKVITPSVVRMGDSIATITLRSDGEYDWKCGPFSLVIWSSYNYCYQFDGSDGFKLWQLNSNGTLNYCKTAISFGSGKILEVLGDTVAIPQPDLKYPSDDYLVKMPDLPAVDEVTGSVTWPSDAAYTKDAIAVPYPVDAEGTKVPDIPYDQVVDQSTGKAIDDTGTDVDNPSKPGEGTDTDTPSDTVNWPDVPSLSLPKLIASKFPFCIPFDVARLVGLLEADAKAPVWHIPFQYSNIVDEEIVIDFDDFSAVIRVIRWGEIILFVAGLILVTRNYIKW